ncbi:hypothetical protein ACLM5J_03760 [Nocardioides sp. Bht2]|uniref:hypothetical protein n=1 Tax=Nocardioides sp. Bht2 TaxID=3392297 RepID=UPI0039B55F44
MKFRKTIVAGLGLALVPGVLTVALANGTAQAQPDPSEDPGGANLVAGIPAEEQADLRAIARDEGISFDQAVDLYGWQNEYAAAAGALENAYPGSYAGSSMNVGGTPGATFRFVGKVPAGVEKLTQAIPVAVHFTGEADYTKEEIRVAVEKAHTAVFEASHSLKGQEVSTEYDEANKTVEVTVAVEASSSDARGALISVAEAALQATRLQIPARVSAAAPGSTGDDVVRGGVVLGGSSSASYSCTSGWPVKEIGVARQGLITADHCPNSMSYVGRNVLTYRSRLPSSSGDIQYMSSTEEVGREFYWKVGSYRTVTGLSAPANDLRLCKFGRSSNETCDSVRDTTTCRDSYCNLVSMDDREAASGDSGGPWYYGTIAYGVHSGYHTHLLQKRDQFTPLYNTLNDVGVKLRTG